MADTVRTFAALLAAAILVVAGEPAAWGATAAGPAPQHPTMPGMSGHGDGGMTHPAAGSRDASTTRWSDHHAYRVSYESTPSPPPLNTLHAWTLTIADAHGQAVGDARLDVDGGMPAHGHGLPTNPQVTSLGGGRYRLEGLKFQMPGAWVVKLTIATVAGTDTVTFNLTVE